MRDGRTLSLWMIQLNSRTCWTIDFLSTCKKSAVNEDKGGLTVHRHIIINTLLSPMQFADLSCVHHKLSMHLFLFVCCFTGPIPGHLFLLFEFSSFFLHFVQVKNLQRYQNWCSITWRMVANWKRKMDRLSNWSSHWSALNQPPNGKSIAFFNFQRIFSAVALFDCFNSDLKGFERRS